MKKMSLTFATLLLLACGGTALAQSDKTAGRSADERALEILFKIVEKNVVGVAEAMPADKYSFAPTDGEFKGVRTFGQQVKHAADAGDETGPDSVRTKAEIIEYLKGSFEYLHRAAITIDEKNAVVGSTPISPLQGGRATRMGLTVEALIHSYDHYGQMVEYLRMNGIVPPASR